MGSHLADMIARMGEMLLSPEMGHVLMLALEGSDHIVMGKSKLSESDIHICQTPNLLLHFIRCITIY